MTPARTKPPIRALAYAAGDAASALSMGETFFREHVAPELRCVRVSGRVLYPVAELEGWLERSANRTLR